MRSSCRRPLAAAGLALAAGLLAAPAHADPAGDDELALSWQGDYGATLTSFVGTPVSVPGDTAGRTLTVRNDGPTAGTLRVTIVNVEILDPDAPDVHHNPDRARPGEDGEGNFYEDLTLSWAVGSDGGAASFSGLHDGGDTVIAEQPLAQGASTEVTIGYDLPVWATSGNRANVAPREASFDVLLEIGGELPAPTPPGEAAPPPRPPALVTTGAAVGWLVVVAAALTGLGIGVRRSSRRS